jgi:ATP-dependent DNA helicase DinG
MQVIVPRNLPEPNRPEYLTALEDLLFDVHVSMGGSVLTLFTNRREMERVYQGLQPRLAAAGLELACQDRNSGTRQLRERFINEKSLSLLALKSFWEGFDASGDTLRCVVIAKLPFSPPNDPLSCERDRREERAWWRYQLPEAVLSVKQAAGRLIRRSTDKGILLLADSRVVSKRYGSQFIKSLPSHNTVELTLSVIPRFIESWRASNE